MINKNFNDIGRSSYCVFFKQRLYIYAENKIIFNNKKFFSDEVKKNLDDNNTNKIEPEIYKNDDIKKEEGEFIWGKMFTDTRKAKKMLAKQTDRLLMSEDELKKDNERIAAIARVKNDRWTRDEELKKEDEQELEEMGYIGRNFTFMIDSYNKNVHEAENKKRQDLEQNGLTVQEQRDLRLIDQQHYLQEHLETHVNPYSYAHWHQRPNEIDPHFLTIEGRIIPESEDLRTEEPEWYEHEFKEEHSHYRTSEALLPNTIHQAMFLTYFEAGKVANGALPKGYVYFHDTEVLREALENENHRLMAIGDDPTKTVASVMYSIYFAGLRESQLGLSKEEMEKSADFRRNGYFDSTMVVKSPQNLGLVFNDKFYQNYYVSDEDKQALLDNEAAVVESVVFAQGSNVKVNPESSFIAENPHVQNFERSFARARPVNKHAAYFRTIAGITDPEIYIEEFIYFHMKFLEKNVDNPGFIAKLGECLGYDREYRLKKLTDFKARCKRRWDRIEELWKLAYENDGKVPLINGEIPNPPEIPLEYFQIEPVERSLFGFKFKITKPAYFERRAERFPGRYDNTWYDPELINFLEPPYTNYEHIGFIMLEIMERVHAFVISNYYDKNDPNHLPIKGIPDYGWRDPSIAEIVESDFAILPGTKVDEFFSMYYARWDDPRVISDYEAASMLYDDCLRVLYPKSVWYESYPQYVKIILGVIDIFLFLFFFIEGVIHTDFYAFVIYIFFANITEWVRW